MIEVAVEEFETLVEDALEAVPDSLMKMIDNVVFIVEDDSEEEGVLGLYDGIPLTERGDYGGMVMPDRIFIYRLPICEMCESREEVIDEVTITVVHEIAHHFGIDDDRLHELGWD